MVGQDGAGWFGVSLGMDAGRTDTSPGHILQVTTFNPAPGDDSPGAVPKIYALCTADRCCARFSGHLRRKGFGARGLVELKWAPAAR